MKANLTIIVFLITLTGCYWQYSRNLTNEFDTILTYSTTDEIAGHMARKNWIVSKNSNRIWYSRYEATKIGEYDYFEFYKQNLKKFIFCFSSSSYKKYDAFINSLSRFQITDESIVIKNCDISNTYKISENCYICNTNFKENRNGFVLYVSSTPNFNMPQKFAIPNKNLPNRPPLYAPNLPPLPPAFERYPRQEKYNYPRYTPKIQLK